MATVEMLGCLQVNYSTDSDMTRCFLGSYLPDAVRSEVEAENSCVPETEGLPFKSISPSAKQSSTRMRVFGSIAVTLSRDLFGDLGQAFPRPDADSRADFEANLGYFKRELERLDDSIAWTSDRLVRQRIRVSCPSVLGWKATTIHGECCLMIV